MLTAVTGEQDIYNNQKQLKKKKTKRRRTRRERLPLPFLPMSEYRPNPFDIVA